MPIFLLREILIFMCVEIVQPVKNNKSLCHSVPLIKVCESGRVAHLYFTLSARAAASGWTGAGGDERVRLCGEAGRCAAAGGTGGAGRASGDARPLRGGRGRAAPRHVGRGRCGARPDPARGGSRCPRGDGGSGPGGERAQVVPPAVVSGGPSSAFGGGRLRREP